MSTASSHNTSASIPYFLSEKNHRKISMVTAYDHWSAAIIATTEIDWILVGDSTAMVMHGHPSTLQADMEMMRLHVSAVARGAPRQLIIADLPFCSYRKGLHHAVEMAESLMRCGAHAVKLEGAEGNLDLIAHLVHSGIPVMGHLGLTPQAMHTQGGFKVQGRDQQQAQRIENEAISIAEAGAFALVLECIPHTLAKKVSQQIPCLTIGIGAGPHTDGQVLVLQDLLGLNPNFTPKFLRKYLDGHTLIKDALNAYHQSVTDASFPLIEEHSFE